MFDFELTVVLTTNCKRSAHDMLLMVAKELYDNELLESEQTGAIHGTLVFEDGDSVNWSTRNTMDDCCDIYNSGRPPTHRC